MGETWQLVMTSHVTRMEFLGSVYHYQRDGSGSGAGGPGRRPPDLRCSQTSGASPKARPVDSLVVWERLTPLPYSRLPTSASTASRISQDLTTFCMVVWSG